MREVTKMLKKTQVKSGKRKNDINCYTGSTDSQKTPMPIGYSAGKIDVPIQSTVDDQQLSIFNTNCTGDMKKKISENVAKSI